jgi:hypothetical protein
MAGVIWYFEPHGKLTLGSIYHGVQNIIGSAIPSISYGILKMVKLGIKRLKAKLWLKLWLKIPSRNLLSDMNLLQYANISGGTFTFNIVNQE